MLVGTAPLFKINLLLADIPWGSCSIFSYFKGVGSESKEYRHHLVMSCKNAASDAHMSDLSDRSLSPLSFRLFYNPRHIFCLILQDVTGPVQQFPCDLDDGLGLAHSFTILVKCLHHHRVLTDSNPASVVLQ